jgi:hypothetical protein
MFLQAKKEALNQIDSNKTSRGQEEGTKEKRKRKKGFSVPITRP